MTTEEHEPDLDAREIAAEIAESLLGRSDLARAAGLDDLAHLLRLAEDEARRRAGLR